MILLWWSAAFISGVVAEAWAGVSPQASALFALGFAACAFAFRRHRVRAVVLVGMGFTLGMLRAPHATGPLSSDSAAFYANRVISVQGVVAAEPDVRSNSILYLIDLNRITLAGKWHAIKGRIQVWTSLSQAVDQGNAVQLRGRLSLPQYRTRTGVTGQMRYPRIQSLGPGETGWRAALLTLRRRVQDGINSWLPQPEAALLIAIVLGAHSASLGVLSPVLARTGLIHIIAISGIKVAMVAGMVYNGAQLFRNRVLALGVGLGVLAVYVLLTGATASGVRSAGMWGMVFVADYLGRRTVALVSLSAVAAGMVALNPTVIADPGFLLSTVGTCSIVALAPTLTRWLHWIPSPWREALATTVAAQIGTVPIVLTYFQSVGLVGPIANMLVLPFLPALILLGFILGLSAEITPLAAPMSVGVEAIIHTVVLIAQACDRVDWAIPKDWLRAPYVVAYYMLGAAVSMFLLRREHFAPVGQWPHRTRELGLAGLAVGVALTAGTVYAGNAPEARLTQLGPGDAWLLQSKGSTVLFDGMQDTLPFLSKLGERMGLDRSIDLVVVTDPRSRNILGVTAILRHYRVAKVLDVGTQYPESSYASWRAQLRQRGVPVYALREGVTVRVGSVTVTAIGPSGLRPDPRDSAGMLEVRGRHRSVLLLGAASREEQFERLFHQLPRVDVLVSAGAQGPMRDIVTVTHARMVRRIHQRSRAGGTTTSEAVFNL